MKLNALYDKMDKLVSQQDKEHGAVIKNLQERYNQ
jgi:hypothetical protein